MTAVRISPLASEFVKLHDVDQYSWFFFHNNLYFLVEKGHDERDPHKVVDVSISHVTTLHGFEQVIPIDEVTITARNYDRS